VHLAVALDGVGFALLPAYLASAEESLIEVLPPDKVVMESLWLVLHQDLQHSAKIRALADFLTTEITKIAPTIRGTRRRKKA
jgi:DNA-binding transcriptional LysR family regulator